MTWLIFCLHHEKKSGETQKPSNIKKQQNEHEIFIGSRKYRIKDSQIQIDLTDWVPLHIILLDPNLFTNLFLQGERPACCC